MAFNLQDNTLAPMFKTLRVSSIISLVTAINFLVLISAVNGEMVLVVIAFITEGTVISSYHEMKELYSSLMLL